jgi:hypothetical protein
MKKSWKKTGTIESIDLNFEECLFIRHMLEAVEIKGKDAFFLVELTTKIVNAFEILEKEQLDLQEETQVN